MEIFHLSKTPLRKSFDDSWCFVSWRHKDKLRSILVNLAHEEIEDGQIRTTWKIIVETQMRHNQSNNVWHFLNFLQVWKKKLCFIKRIICLRNCDCRTVNKNNWIGEFLREFRKILFIIQNKSHHFTSDTKKRSLTNHSFHLHCVPWR